MKRITSLLIILALAMSFLGVSASTRRQIEVDANLITVNVNGTEIQADNFLYNGTTYVPIRAVAEAFNAIIRFNDEAKTASINATSIDLVMKGIRFHREAGEFAHDILTHYKFIETFTKDGDFSELKKSNEGSLEMLSWYLTRLKEYEQSTIDPNKLLVTLQKMYDNYYLVTEESLLASAALEKGQSETFMEHYKNMHESYLVLIKDHYDVMGKIDEFFNMYYDLYIET